MNLGSDGPLVSAIIPAYNRPRRTQRAVDSVAAQSYRPLELIVIDDGSVPPLEERLSLPEDTLEKTVVVRHEENRGANVARNAGIEIASGQYLAFLDSDDEWLPEKIERQVARLERSDHLASYTGAKHIDHEGRLNAVRRAIRSGDLLGVLLREDIIGMSSVVIETRNALEAAGPPDPGMPAWQDWEWYLRLAGAGVTWAAVREPLVRWHHDGEQLSGDYELKRDGAYPVMQDRIRHFARSEREARRGLACLDFRLGYSALANGRYSEARRLFLRAIRGHMWEPAFYLFLGLAGPHYPLMRRVKRWAVRLIH